MSFARSGTSFARGEAILVSPGHVSRDGRGWGAHVCDVAPRQEDLGDGLAIVAKEIVP